MAPTRPRIWIVLLAILGAVGVADDGEAASCALIQRAQEVVDDVRGVSRRGPAAVSDILSKLQDIVDHASREQLLLFGLSDLEERASAKVGVPVALVEITIDAFKSNLDPDLVLINKVIVPVWLGNRTIASFVLLKTATWDYIEIRADDCSGPPTMTCSRCSATQPPNVSPKPAGPYFVLQVPGVHFEFFANCRDGTLFLTPFMDYSLLSISRTTGTTFEDLIEPLKEAADRIRGDD